MVGPIKVQLFGEESGKRTPGMSVERLPTSATKDYYFFFFFKNEGGAEGGIKGYGGKYRKQKEDQGIEHYTVLPFRPL